MLSTAAVVFAQTLWLVQLIPGSTEPPVPFTVFTATYNRAHTLRRVLESLRQQQEELFEWLVVDDGSTDGTIALLEQFGRSCRFRIRTISQARGGKHRAHNAAVKSARGELLVILDSDDELTPGALELLWAEWRGIPEKERAGIAGILGHAVSPSGQLVGHSYPSHRLDGRFFELVASRVIVGEKAACFRTDILQNFPFPERPGCIEYVPEGIVWTQIGTSYLMRCLDEVVRVYHRDDSDRDALMNSLTRPDRNSWGRMQYCRTLLNLSAQYWPRFARRFVTAAAGYARYSLHAGYSIRRQSAGLGSSLARALWIATLPIAYVAWAIDRLRRWIETGAITGR